MSLNISKIGFLIRRNYSSVKDFYTKNHEWIKLLPNENTQQSPKQNLRARIGITDYSQKALGDIVFIEMPKIETKYNADDPISVVESVKGANDVYCPIAGTITTINSAVLQKPALLNKSPEIDGWICEIEYDEKELGKSNLMTYQEYVKYCKSSQ